MPGMSRHQAEQFIMHRDEQGKKCAICGSKERLCLDHDHVTGRIRGVLCGKCNTNLGWIEKYADEVSTYLERNQGTPYRPQQMHV